MLIHKNFKFYSRCIAILISLNLIGCASLENLGNSISDTGASLFGSDTESEPPKELTEYKPELEADFVWQANIGDGKNNKYLKLNLAVDSGDLFVAAREGIVQARVLNTGVLVWEHESEVLYSAGPGIGANTVILGTSNAQVIALDKTSGTQTWTSNVSSEILATPVIAKNVVIIRTTDGLITALDENTGKQLWSFEKHTPPLSIRGISTPIIFRDTVIASYANGKLVALNLKTGKNIWETSIAMPQGRSEVERLVDLDTDLIQHNDIIYLSSYNGGTSAVAATDGKMLWRNDELSAYVGLSADYRYLYLSDKASDVWKIEQRSGRTLWKQENLHFRSLSMAANYAEYVVVGDYEGYLHWLSRTDGRELTRLKIADAAIDSHPLILDDTVYIYAKDGTLAAVKARLF